MKRLKREKALQGALGAVDRKDWVLLKSGLKTHLLPRWFDHHVSS
jgi:hypothetical protein